MTTTTTVRQTTAGTASHRRSAAAAAQGPADGVGAPVLPAEKQYQDLRQAALAGQFGKPVKPASMDDLPLQQFLVRPGTAIHLDELPTEIVGKGGKPSHPGARVAYSEYTDDEAQEKLEKLRKKIYDKLSMLHEQGTVGLQENLDALNAGGKDGTIARTYAVNPEWVHTHNFKGPEGQEKQHLAEPNWRFMQEFAHDPGSATVWCRGPVGDPAFIDMTPAGKGKSEAEIGALRADRAAGIKEMQLGVRYGLPMNPDGHIDPQGLARYPSMVVNVFLNVSYAEQGRRLLDRLNEKVIKAGHPDLKEHFETFDHDRDAFAESLSLINTPDAPVWVIPADNKVQASLAHAQLINGLLKLIDPSEPQSNPDVSIAERQHYIQLLQRELAAEAPEKKGHHHKN